MGNQRFANRASSVLAGPITNAAGTLTVSASEGARFPALSAGQWFTALLQDGDGDGALREFIKVTNRVNDVLTIERGTEGSVARAWPIGTNVAHIVTAAGMDALAGDDELLAVQTQLNDVDADVAALTTQVTNIDADLTAAENAILTKEPQIAAGTAAQYWRGDKTWRDLFTDVRAATLAGLSLASTAAITTADTVLTALGRVQAQITANLATVTAALALRVSIDSTTGAAQLPAGTTVQRPAAGAGKFRFNSDLGRFEGNNGASWGSLGGATGGGNDAVFYVNGQTVTSDYTIPAGQNAMSAGPITIANGVAVTIPDGSVWTIV